MPSYLVETYLARGRAGERTAREARARSAAEELTHAGTRVRFDGVIHVPEDEICFFMFGASSSREAALVAQRAELDPLRVVEAVTSAEGGRHVEEFKLERRLRSSALLLVAALTVWPRRNCPGGCGDTVERERGDNALFVVAGQGPQQSVPHLAMVHGAIYDAVNAIDGGHEGYLLTSRVAQPFDSEDAAVAAAAHRVLLNIVPTSRPSSTRSTRRRWRRFRTARRRRAESQSGRPQRRR